jgi:hypothetical protein
LKKLKPDGSEKWIWGSADRGLMTTVAENSDISLESMTTGRP